jgi:hypothetical protein
VGEGEPRAGCDRDGGRGELAMAEPEWQVPSVTIEDLERWEENGAVWRAYEVTDERALIDLCSCTGEPMDRVQSDAPELIEFVRARRDS